MFKFDLLFPFSTEIMLQELGNAVTASQQLKRGNFAKRFKYATSEFSRLI
jgi:hypothetical protein